MRTPKENKQKPRDRTPKSTAGTIPKATLKAVWLKTKEQTRTAAHENDTNPRQQETIDLAGSAAEQAAAFVRHQGRKLAETQARQHRQKEAVARAHTAGERGVSPKQAEYGTLPDAAQRPRRGADLPRQRAKEKAVTAKTAPRDIRGVTQGQRQLHTAANETVRSVMTQAQMQTHAQKIRLAAQKVASGTGRTTVAVCSAIRHFLASLHSLVVAIATGICYGYQLVDQGRRNKRDKPVMDLVVNEEEAAWVRELFYKVVNEGASGYALAEMLNNRGLRTRAGAKFQASNVLRIIRHEGYTGYIITKNARSEYIPELQIIDKDTFDRANDSISRRSTKIKQEKQISHTCQNPTLLAGIVYCAHCGAKMSGFMHKDRYKLADGTIREKVQPKYNCFQRAQKNKGGRDCDGQSLYLAETVDAIVLEVVRKVFAQIKDTPYSRVAEQRIRQESNLQKVKRVAIEKKMRSAQHALERFESEILKCLDGTSCFTEDMIAKQIRKSQKDLDDAKAEFAELQKERINETAEIRKLRSYYDDFRGWADEFDSAPLEIKRTILSQLIDRVEVGRKYAVTIKFNMSYQQFLECDKTIEQNEEIGA